MISQRGPIVKARGLQVYAETGKQGSEAVVIAPSLPGDPEMPPHLVDLVAQQEWYRMVGLLRSLGILSPAIGPSLTLYCLQFSRMVAAETHIAQHGLMSKYVQIARDSAIFCRIMLSQFGLTPVSTVKVRTQPPRDELEDFLSNHH